MQPKSHTLFHFTKNLDFLKDILLNGFWPRYCLEDSKWYSITGEDYYLAYPMVCFCDIPLSRVDEHVSFYGNYGIGVTRNWADSSGLSPVIYVKENSPQHQAIKNVLTNNANTELYEASNRDMNAILSNIKPTEGTMRFGSEVVEKDFYQENEWRYTPIRNNFIWEIRSWLSEVEYLDGDTLQKANQTVKQKASLKVMPSDIKYLFVKSDQDIPHLVNFIQTELDNFPSHEIKILLSRIVSLETISRDF